MRKRASIGPTTALLAFLAGGAAANAQEVGVTPEPTEIQLSEAEQNSVVTEQENSCEYVALFELANERRAPFGKLLSRQRILTLGLEGVCGEYHFGASRSTGIIDSDPDELSSEEFFGSYGRAFEWKGLEVDITGAYLREADSRYDAVLAIAEVRKEILEILSTKGSGVILFGEPDIVEGLLSVGLEVRKEISEKVTLGMDLGVLAHFTEAGEELQGVGNIFLSGEFANGSELKFGLKPNTRIGGVELPRQDRSGKTSYVSFSYPIEKNKKRKR